MSYPIPHKGDIVSRVIEGSFEIIGESAEGSGLCQKHGQTCDSLTESRMRSQEAAGIRSASQMRKARQTRPSQRPSFSLRDALRIEAKAIVGRAQQTTSIER